VGTELRLEYFDGLGWGLVDTWISTGTPGGSWSLRDGTLGAPGALHSGLQVRLISTSSAGEWLLDDFLVGCGEDLDGDHVPSWEDCDDLDAWHWSDCGLCVDLDGDGFGAQCDLGEDCDDADSAIFPGQYDPVGDFIDQDCDGIDGTGLFDDFEYNASWDPAVWVSVTGDTFQSSSYSTSGTYSMNLGGGGATATTQPINTSACGSIDYSWQGKRGPETPDSGDNVQIEYLNDMGVWVNTDTWAGSGITDPGFSLFSGGIIAPDATHTGFQLRLVSNGSGSSFDDFFIDDFSLSCSP